MSTYIVCQKKRNNPRMDIRICQKKCELKGECEEYLSLHKLINQGNGLRLTAESRSLQIDMALHPAGQ
jgi:hypothetical protein